MAELENRLSSTFRSSGSIPSLAQISSSPTTWTDDTPTPRFPSALFLDADCYEWARMKLLRSTTAIPKDILTILNQGNGILEIYQTYFNTIHCWMPIISKKRIDLGILFREGGPDLAILLLAMKLVTTSLDLTGNLYRTVREFFLALEADNMVLLHFLQAMILVALYKYSHSIYPAAWMTVEACSRYADIIGLSLSGQCLSSIGSNKYFDSGDFALSAAHRMADEGAIQTGTSHPIRASISHPFSPVPNASNVSRDANKDVLTQGKHPLSKMVHGHLRNELNDGDVKAEDTGEIAARATIGDD
ncbi:hypothetical protein BDV27DRAFT_154798 [Aspergillus caelatus]|uniref:Transcription factor domain-containing protein n=1 Tax=Aspergillus caelatus TaxID=61420 RepID=A0A5N7ADB5_9EURO|nr:uncharacterized protein BDV27DRAFT_154798 [Aspergillus caelatus]KAE8367653.1 hypothetical protein BDV27DRAFT_154798 [Aspergillus caelatus]